MLIYLLRYCDLCYCVIEVFNFTSFKAKICG